MLATTIIGTGIIWIPCIILFLIGGKDLKHKIIGSLICIAIWVLMAGGLYFQEIGNQQRWNDGYCQCGQHWELSAVVRSRSNSSEKKYYTCPNCYTEIVIIK